MLRCVHSTTPEIHDRRERERERERDRERDRDRDRDRERQRERDRETESQRQTDRQTEGTDLLTDVKLPRLASYARAWCNDISWLDL